jgi:hypothetical protein
MIGAWMAFAQAATTVALDLDVSKTLYSEDPYFTGEGTHQVEWTGQSKRPAGWATLRAGQAFGVGPAELIPEVTLGMVLLGTAWYDSNPASEVRTTLGLRAGAKGPVRPGVYGHVGAGFGGYRVPYDRDQRGRETAITLDAGAYVTVPISKLELGLHGGWELFPPWWGNASTLMGGLSVGLRL